MRIGCQVLMWRSTGWSSFIHKEDIGPIIGSVGKVGVDGVEVFAAQLKPYHERPGSFRALLADAGVRLSGAYFSSDEFINPAGAEDVVREAATDCEFLREVGGGFLLLSGDTPKGDPPRTFSDEDFRQLAKVLNRIGTEAAGRGVQTVLHPHEGYMVETPGDVDRLLGSGLDQDLVGLCVHAEHQLSSGADPYAIYEKHASWVRYMHIGDQGSDGESALLGEGVLDQERLMRPVLEAGFDGWIIIECGVTSVPPEEYARSAVAYLEETWPEINWEK